MQPLKNNRLLASLATVAILAGTTMFAATASAVGPEVTTLPATSITTSDATINGMNGDADAQGTAFWVSTSTFSVASSASPTLPAGVHGTGDLGAVSSSTAFSAELSDATIPAGLLPITEGTTYYYAAWVNIGGVWYPGEVLSVTTLPDAPTVTGISPSTGTTTGGTIVTITGTGFTGATGVSFGSTPATGVTVDSDTSITATSPAGTGAVNVTVTTAGGTSATSSADVFTYVAPSVLAPVISDVEVSGVDNDGATITWTTDTPASSQVNFGTTTSYGSSSAYSGTATTSHSVTLTGLDEITTYQIQVVSGNETGTTTATTTLTTTSTSSSTPLALLSTEAVDTNGIANGEWADGWHWILTFTVPDNETNLQMRFTDFEDDDGHTFPANGNIRIFTAESSNATSSSSAVIAEGNDYGDVVLLTGDSDAGTPGRQVEVHVQVKIPFGTTPGSNYTTTFGVLTDTP